MANAASPDLARAAPTGPDQEPFESPGELRREHDALLELVDREVGEDASRDAETAAVLHLAARVRAFVARGAATGVYLDETRDRTACQVLVDYWATALSRAGAPAPPSRLAPFDGERLPVLRDDACPYVGLEAFTTREHFFGREQDTATLLAQLRASPLVVVSGASGSGKSSLVMGGLLPAVRADAAAPLRVLAPFVPGTDPVGALAAAVAPLAAGSAPVDPALLRGEPARLAALLGGAQAPATLLTVDQFEEVFTLAGTVDREAFVAALAALLEAGRGHRVLLTVREEFRTRIVELRALAKWLETAWYTMRPMTYDELRAAVERPAAAANLRFQAGIVDDLVKKVLGQAAALPLLQFTLRELWNHRRRNRITREVYEAVGDPLKALEASADRFYEALPREMQDEVKRLLLELVRVDELLEAYRQPVARSRLEAGRANTGAVLAALEENDFVRVIPGDGDPVVEVKHEALVRNWPRLVSWIEQKRYDRRRRIALTEAAKRWRAAGKPEAGLLTGWQLEEAERAADLSDVEKEFVEASAGAAKERERAEVRRRRRTIVVLSAMVAGLLVAVGAIGAAFWHLRGEFARIQEREQVLRKEKETLTRGNEELTAAQEKLTAKQERLQREKDELEAKYNALAAPFSANVAQALRPATERGRGPATIYLHISSEDQRRRADEIATQLKKNGIRVPGIQRVDPVPSSDVRYFHAEDRAQAAEIVNLLTSYVGGEPLKPLLVKGFEEKVRAAVFEIWFGESALGAAAPRDLVQQSAAARAYLVVLGNDADCAAAAGSYFRARTGLTRALGPEFDPGRLRLLAGTAQGQQFLVTAYGGDLTAETAARLLDRLRGRPDLPADVYSARRQFYQEQKGCDVVATARTQLRDLADRYRTLRASTAASEERTSQMNQLFSEMRRAAAVAALDPRAVEALYRSRDNPEGSRLAALAAIGNDPKPEHLPLLLESIRAPLPGSAFEQYQAIRLLDRLAPSLDPRQRAEAQRALEEAWRADTVHVRTDASRAQPVQRLLRTLPREPENR